MAKLRHHSFRSDTGTSKRRPDGQIRNGNITHPTRVAPVVTGIQVVPGASAQAATTTNRKASGAEGVIAEPKKTLTRIEQCITDAAELAPRVEEWTAEDLNGALRNLFNQVGISGASFRVMKIAPQPLFPNLAHLQPLPTSANPPPGEPTRQREEASQNTSQVDGRDDHRVPAAAKAAAEDAAATEADAAAGAEADAAVAATEKEATEKEAAAATAAAAEEEAVAEAPEAAVAKAAASVTQHKAPSWAGQGATATSVDRARSLRLRGAGRSTQAEEAAAEAPAAAAEAETEVVAEPAVAVPGAGAHTSCGWASAVPAKLACNMLVRLYGLRARPELNGAYGTIIGAIKADGRYPF
jgi:hypothetical protein